MGLNFNSKDILEARGVGVGTQKQLQGEMELQIISTFYILLGQSQHLIQFLREKQVFAQQSELCH